MLAPMLIITWNVASLRARLPRVLGLLELHKPDVVCLQETKCTAENFPLAELMQAGYGVVQHSGGAWSGVAILVRSSTQEADPLVGLPGDPVPSEARWVETDTGGLRIVSAYVPNGRALDNPEFPRKLAFLEAAAKRAAALCGHRLVICGDFNVIPQDIDVYDPAPFIGATHITPAERSRLADIQAQGQLLDAYRALHPTEQQFTWWDYRAGNFHKNLGQRIDLALISRSLAPQLLECGIDRDFRKGPKPSDHAPLLVRLAI